MAENETRDAFVDTFVAKFDGRSRAIAEAQHAQAVGEAKAAWADILAALDKRDAAATAVTTAQIK